MIPELIERLRALDSEGVLNLPVPGAGQTAERHVALLEFGRADLSLARLAEAHVDALAILTEAGRTPGPAELYGVWASDGPGSRLELQRRNGGQLLLNGLKKYCTGASLLDCSLVTAYEGAYRVLVKVSLRAKGLTVDDSEWATSAFAATKTATVRFDAVAVEPEAIIGGPDWYLTRPGFWHGALGPAACWAGGAIGLIDATRRVSRDEPHFRAHLGALEASEWGLNAVLNEAGHQIDADAQDSARGARKRALMARHLIERQCMDVLDRFGRATGPALLAFDAPIAQRFAELTLYLRQCHAERDLAEISRL
jgi:alkylation response protein AidB-like acyl-CoA dehydrogenase